MKSPKNKIYIVSMVLILILLSAVFAQYIAPYGYNDINLDSIWTGISKEHILGTDKLGRDIFSRLLYGGKISISIALIVEVIAFPIGTFLGYISAIKSNYIISILDRLMDVLFSFPTIILALTLSGIMGVSINSIIIAIALAEIPIFFRYTKVLVLKLYNEPFIQVLKTLGVNSTTIFKSHVLSHILPPLIPKIIFNFGSTIIFESTLSFIGIGIQAPVPSWGNMIRDGIPYINTHPFLVFFSSITLAIVILMLFSISDKLEKKIMA